MRVTVSIAIAIAGLALTPACVVADDTPSDAPTTDARDTHDSAADSVRAGTGGDSRGDTSAPTPVRFTEVTLPEGSTWDQGTFAAAWGDVNGDGFPDAWVGNHAEPAHLFLNDTKGGFTQAYASQTTLAEGPRYDAHGVVIVDLDDDRDQDVVEVVGAEQGEGAGRNRIYRSVDGTLVEQTADAEPDLSWPDGSGRTVVPFDADRDGDLDIFLETARRGDGLGGSVLLRQTAPGTYTPDVLATADQHANTKGAVWADVTGDWRAELVRWARPNILVVHDVTKAGVPSVPDLLPPVLQVEELVVADFDNDTKNDLYVGRLPNASEGVVMPGGQEIRLALEVGAHTESVAFTSAGDITVTLDPPWQWSAADIAVGASCTPADDYTVTAAHDDTATTGRCGLEAPATRGVFVGREGDRWTVSVETTIFRRAALRITLDTPATDVVFTEINTLDASAEDGLTRDQLFLRTADGWDDRTEASGLTSAYCHSVVAFDVDNDMDLDLYRACSTDTVNVENELWLNDGSGRFTRAQGHGAEGTDIGLADTVQIADIDRDGFLDLLVTNGKGSPLFGNGPTQLFRNEGNDNHWLLVDLFGTTSHRDAIGAHVFVTAGGVTQVRAVGTQQRRMAVDHRRLHFGLGPNQLVDEIRIRWPDGREQINTNLTADLRLYVSEPMP